MYDLLTRRMQLVAARQLIYVRSGVNTRQVTRGSGKNTRDLLHSSAALKARGRWHGVGWGVGGVGWGGVEWSGGVGWRGGVGWGATNTNCTP